MKIVDTTSFYNEYDILELRLATMYEYVDKFVILECDRTHTGKYKGFNLEKQLDRYTKWWDKVHYIKLVDGCKSSDAWENEHWQRNQMPLGWQDLGPDDVIMVSDCDEIVRPEAIQFIRHTNYGCYRLMMPVFYFKFNYLDTKKDWHYKDWGRAFRGWQSSGLDMRFRNEVPGKESICLHHAGWHFSWLGDEEFAKTKIKSFCHTEVDQPHIVNNLDIEKFITQGTDHFRPENITWVTVKLDRYFPKYVLDNKDKYSNFILPDTDKTVQDYWPYGILQPA